MSLYADAIYASLYFEENEVYAYSNVRRWTDEVDIFWFDKIFIPVHVPGHWFCMVIFMKEQTIEVLDSLGRTHMKHLEVAFRYLSDEHQHRKRKPLPGKWKLYHCSEKNILHQPLTNGHDCGVYTCMNADRLSRINKIEFASGDSTIYRKRMALQIATKNIPKKSEAKATRSTRKVPIVIDLTGDNPELTITMTDDRPREKDPVVYSSFPRIKLINETQGYREVEATTEYSPSDTSYLSATYVTTKVTVQAESMPKNDVVSVVDDEEKGVDVDVEVSNVASKVTVRKQDEGVIGVSNDASNGSTSTVEVADSDDDSCHYDSPDTDSNTIDEFLKPGDFIFYRYNVGGGWVGTFLTKVLATTFNNPTTPNKRIRLGLKDGRILDAERYIGRIKVDEIPDFKISDFETNDKGWFIWNDKYNDVTKWTEIFKFQMKDDFLKDPKTGEREADDSNITQMAKSFNSRVTLAKKTAVEFLRGEHDSQKKKNVPKSEERKATNGTTLPSDEEDDKLLDRQPPSQSSLWLDSEEEDCKEYTKRPKSQLSVQSEAHRKVEESGEKVDKFDWSDKEYENIKFKRLSMSDDDDNDDCFNSKKL